jgi:hypothetical protein
MTERELRATHSGNLKIGSTSISCAVLNDGRRVLVERSMATALGKKGGGAYWEKKKRGETGILPPEYISAKNLQPYISEELRQKFENPISYIDKQNRLKNGLEATILSDICHVWIAARDAGALTELQKETAKRAYMLMRGFATVGITALVDEATGFQEVRDRQALQEILERYISGHLLDWAKKFPDEFYRELFRLKNWQWKGMSVNRPIYVGKLTNDIVYSRLAPGVLCELRRKTPRDEKGFTKHRYHQWLTDDVGNPALANHLHAVIALMKASSTWQGFIRALQRAFPKLGETPELPLDDVE